MSTRFALLRSARFVRLFGTASKATPERRLALLIDGDNACAAKFDNTVLGAQEHGVLVSKRLYANFSRDEAKNWKGHALRHNLELMHQFTNGKNAIDIALVIGAMDLMQSQKLDGFVIVSGDGDFTPLASRLRRDGYFVMGIGSEQHTSESLKKACDVFRCYEELPPTPCELRVVKRAERKVEMQRLQEKEEQEEKRERALLEAKELERQLLATAEREWERKPLHKKLLHWLGFRDLPLGFLELGARSPRNLVYWLGLEAGDRATERSRAKWSEVQLDHLIRAVGLSSKGLWAEGSVVERTLQKIQETEKVDQQSDSAVEMNFEVLTQHKHLFDTKTSANGKPVVKLNKSTLNSLKKELAPIITLRRAITAYSKEEGQGPWVPAYTLKLLLVKENPKFDIRTFSNGACGKMRALLGLFPEYVELRYTNSGSQLEARLREVPWHSKVKAVENATRTQL